MTADELRREYRELLALRLKVLDAMLRKVKPQ